MLLSLGCAIVVRRKYSRVGDVDGGSGGRLGLVLGRVRSQLLHRSLRRRRSEEGGRIFKSGCFNLINRCEKR